MTIDGGEGVPTLEELLEEAEEARRAGADIVEIDFHPETGHPTSIEIDHDEQAIDDEACYVISNYQGNGMGHLDGTWRLVSGRGPDGPVPLVADRPITLLIDGDQIGGNSACNDYGGQVKIDGDRFAIKKMQMTLIGCTGAVGRSEDAYVEALRAATSIRRSNDQLILTGPEVHLAFEFP
jgi:heat shock protein HslJ